MTLEEKFKTLGEQVIALTHIIEKMNNGVVDFMVNHEKDVGHLRELIDEARWEHSQLAYALGTYFGYPHCCKMEFCEDITNKRDPGKRNIDGSGFIPCSKHYTQIREGTIKLDDLIKARACPIPFREY